MALGVGKEGLTPTRGWPKWRTNTASAAVHCIVIGALDAVISDDWFERGPARPALFAPRQTCLACGSEQALCGRSSVVLQLWWDFKQCRGQSVEALRS